MNYFCGHINHNGSNDIWYNDIIKYNPHLEKTNDFVFSDFQIVTFGIDYKKNSDSIAGIFRNGMCFLYIDGYIFYDNLYVTENSIQSEKEILFNTISEIIDKQEYFRLNNFGGSFLILMKYANKIYIISDNITSKQLFYTKVNNFVIFSNDLRLILANNCINLDINEQKCKSFCSSIYAIHEADVDNETFFEKIYKINSGSILIINSLGDIYEKNYFEEYNVNDIPFLAGNGSIEFRKTINSIVHGGVNQSVSQNIGISLSGGIDSAVVLASLIDSGYKNRAIAYHMSFRDTNLHQCSDHETARALIKDTGIKGRILYIDDSLRMKNSDLGSDHLSYVNGPALLGNELAYDMLAPIINNDYVDLVLTGDGGDYLFMGTKYCGDYYMRNHMYSEALRRSIKLSKSSKKIDQIWSYLLYNVVPLLPYISNKMYKKIFWGDIVNFTPDYVNPEINNIVDVDRATQLSSTGKNIKNWYRKFIFDFMFPKGPYVGVGIDSFSFSLPFEDNLMFKTAASIPPNFHYDIYRGGQGEYRIRKMVLRRAFGDILPHYITHQKNKTNYTNMNRHILYNDKCNIGKLICERNALLCSELDIVNKTKFKNKIQSVLLLSGDKNFTGGQDINFYMNIIRLEIWLSLVNKGKEFFLKLSEIGGLFSGKIDMEEV